MKTLRVLLIAGATAIARALRSGSDQNILYFPPQDSSPSSNPLNVHAGDMINITWSTTYPSTDLHIEAWAPDSNFTVTPYYNPSLDSQSFFPYVLQPRDYLVNDSSTEIQAFFVLVDHADTTQYIRSQNFTIQQPKQQSINPEGQFTIPPDASTWTGSVTLYSSEGFATGANPAGAGGTTTTTTSRAAPSTQTATPSNVGDSSPSSGPIATPSASPTSSSAAVAASSSDTLTSGAKAGIGIGVILGVLLLAGFITVSILLIRQRRRSAGVGVPLPIQENHYVEKPANYSQQGPRAEMAGQNYSSYNGKDGVGGRSGGGRGHDMIAEMGGGTTGTMTGFVSELDEQRIFAELGADERR